MKETIESVGAAIASQFVKALGILPTPQAAAAASIQLGAAPAEAGAAVGPTEQAAPRARILNPNKRQRAKLLKDELERRKRDGADKA